MSSDSNQLIQHTPESSPGPGHRGCAIALLSLAGMALGSVVGIELLQIPNTETLRAIDALFILLTWFGIFSNLNLNE